jgi:isoamylase
LNELLDRANIEWHGVTLNQPDWGEHSHSLAFTFSSLSARYLIHGLLSAYWEPLTFELPPGPESAERGWRRVIDTGLPAPQDFIPWDVAPRVTSSRYTLQPRSIALFMRSLQQRQSASRSRL